MSARIIDGRTVAKRIQNQLRERVAAFAERGRPIKLVAVQVGDDPASRMYVNMQRRRAEAVGIAYELCQLPATCPEARLVETIDRLNNDPNVTAMIVQMPLPESMDPRLVQVRIAQEKDAEAIHPANMGRLFYDDYKIAPPTPAAAVMLLHGACADLSGKEALVVGHSEIVGKPIAAMLLASRQAAPTVTVSHVATRELAEHVHRAEVLIVAAGASQRRWAAFEASGRKSDPPDLRPLIRAEDVREGAIIIDVAINYVPKALDEHGRPVLGRHDAPEMHAIGDVDFDGVLHKAAAVTPVPGGVGPVTVAMLLENTLACARFQADG
jgi:methylenetetrahydrofolate dehydrogenase (NADP+)/methenyltetrahydrofolate cyclohydrolase